MLSRWYKLSSLLNSDVTEEGSRDRIISTFLWVLIIVCIPVSFYHLLTDRILAGLLLILGIAPFFICLVLIRREHARLAYMVLLLTMLFLSSLLIVSGYGMEDVAILLYPAIIMVASLLLRPKAFLILVTITLIVWVSIAYADWSGWIAVEIKPNNVMFSEALMGVLILGITAIIMMLLAENSRQNLAQRQKKQQDLFLANQQLIQEINDRQRVEKSQLAIYRISEAAQTAQSLNQLYPEIHHIIDELMPAKNFFIAIYDPEEDLFHIPYLSDEYDHHWDPYPPGKGLGAYVMKTGNSILVNPDSFAELEKSGEVEIISRRMVDWLGVPLKNQRGTFGVMAVQTYHEDERLYPTDKDMLTFVSAQVAAAIERKQNEQERERLIDDLELKNAELERFTYTVSHDLKSPLITIRGFADFLERDLEEGNKDRIRNDVFRINQSAEKMHDLLNDLLELSRIGRLMNPPEKAPFGEIVHEALQLLEGPLTEKMVAVDVNPNLPEIYGDRSRLVEALQNLIENSIKFMGDQPEPRITIGSQENMVNGMPVCYVRDNGIGIDPAFHEKVFGLFEKLEVNSEGTGIGLALVKRIIEEHGGTIWISSEGHGQGCTFYFTLPTDTKA